MRPFSLCLTIICALLPVAEGVQNPLIRAGTRVGGRGLTLAAGGVRNGARNGARNFGTKLGGHGVRMGTAGTSNGMRNILLNGGKAGGRNFGTGFRPQAGSGNMWEHMLSGTSGPRGHAATSMVKAMRLDLNQFYKQFLEAGYAKLHPEKYFAELRAGLKRSGHSNVDKMMAESRAWVTRYCRTHGLDDIVLQHDVYEAFRKWVRGNKAWIEGQGNPAKDLVEAAITESTFEVSVGMREATRGVNRLIGHWIATNR